MREDPRPDLTPLVDIVFNLLLFFVVTTTFAATGGIGVKLPESSNRQPIEQTEKIIVTMDREGGVYVSGAKKNLAELSAVLSDLAAKNRDALVIIQADRQTRHGLVVAVMDMAQGLGLKRLAIATEKKLEPAAEVNPSPPPGAGVSESSTAP
jgi:biopolymer transport protein ExbD